MEKYFIERYLKLAGELIKNTRIDSNITSKKAAENLLISPQYYSSLENTKNKKVSLLLVLKIANNVYIKPSELFFETDYRIRHSKNYYDYFIESDRINVNELLECIFNEIAEERKSKGMTQQSIADKLGITRRYYGDIETGKNKSISLYRLLEITEVIGTPLYILVERAEQSLLEANKDHK